MPPNLGGFFMVRSYYPSECHADYFDFERIEALKPAIEACGISTSSQSPMLGFHEPQDTRITLLAALPSFWLPGGVFAHCALQAHGRQTASSAPGSFVSASWELL